MTTPVMNNTAMPAGADAPSILEPAPAEVERVLHLFGNVRLCPEARLLAAARSRPIQRFIAAAAWWPMGKAALFQIACLPGVDRTTVAGLLIERLGECARLARLETLQYAHLLPDGNDWFGILRKHLFKCLRSERSFEVAYQDAWTRIMQLHQKHGDRIPASWQARPIRDLPPETALEVIGSHRLLAPGEVRAFWRKNAPGGFTLDLSCVLFDGDRPFGAFLARRMGDVYYVDVQVVQEKNPILRSLGDLFMMYRMLILHSAAQRAGADVPIRWLRFRSGEIEHRQTANLALRMGGRELPPCHVMAKSL
ncbi:MAG: hypothetical protein ABSG59_00375 [Verrucomicrobiota bacterium]|jgi:hypothetical protein